MSNDYYIRLVNVYLDAKNEPPQYIVIITEEKRLTKRSILFNKITQIAPAKDKKIKDIEKTLIEASIVELKKICDEYPPSIPGYPSGYGYITIHCSTNSCVEFEKLFQQINHINLFFFYNPRKTSKIKKLKKTVIRVEEKKNKEIILLHL